MRVIIIRDLPLLRAPTLNACVRGKLSAPTTRLGRTETLELLYERKIECCTLVIDCAINWLCLLYAEAFLIL